MTNLTSLDVANLYSNTQGLGQGSPAQSGGETLGTPSFGDLLESGVRDAINTQKAAETASAQAVTGEAELTDVVAAITNAEVTLDTVVAVRDRLVSAMQEILRMPI